MAAASVTARLSRAIACSLRLPVSRCTLTVAPAAAASSPATVLGLRHGSRQQHRKAASTLAPPVSLAIPLPTFVAARQSLAPRRTAGHAQSAAITTSAHGLEEGGPDGNASSALAAPGVLRLPMLGSLGSSASVADAAGHVQLALNPLHTADQLAHAIADETGFADVGIFAPNGDQVARSTPVGRLLAQGFSVVLNGEVLQVPTQTQDETESHGAMPGVMDAVWSHLEQANAIMQQRAQLRSRLSDVEAELASLEDKRRQCLDKAVRRSRLQGYATLAGLCTGLGFFARLTWWELSWDIMEPVTYFVGYTTSMGCLAYFVLTSRDFGYEKLAERKQLRLLHKYGRSVGLDVTHYNELLRVRYQLEQELLRL
eukprot:m.58420 g.58420  ORF g.58420 m.58420 type:complete len:371 (+) comp12865_c0_seq1:415-1527(+)